MRPGPQQPASLRPPSLLLPVSTMLLGRLATRDLAAHDVAVNKEQVTQATCCLVALLSPWGQHGEWWRRHRGPPGPAPSLSDWIGPLTRLHRRERLLSTSGDEGRGRGSGRENARPPSPALSGTRNQLPGRVSTSWAQPPSVGLLSRCPRECPVRLLPHPEG